MNFDGLYAFTERGLGKFKEFCRGGIPQSAIDLSDQTIATKLVGTKPFKVETFETSKAMAQSISAAFGTAEFDDELSNEGLWCWLTFVLHESLFKKGKDGVVKYGALEAWFPSPPNDYAKAQRHKVRMPVQLYRQFGDDADHALCGAPHTPGEVREQCTGQQGMFTQVFQKFCKALYFDAAKQTFKKGAGGKDGGSPRRLAQVVRQFEVTWDIHSFSVDDWLEKLPAEFDRYKENA